MLFKMQKQIVLKIYGKVQGVFFRDSSRREAQKLNLVGWAKNEMDGTVQIIAEGEEGDLQEMIKWCQNGFGHFGKVEKVDVKWTEPLGQFNDFVVK